MEAGPIETPAEALGPTVCESVSVRGRVFLVERPDAVDRLTDHPVLGGTSASEEYKPFWASIWPAARMLAQAILEEPWPERRPLRALEIGCGLGLPGLAALARGLHVTFSDFDRAALRYAAASARRNDFDDFDTLAVDWRQPPAGLRVPVLLASEPIYVAELVDVLADFVQRVLEPGGCFLLADQERRQAAMLRQALRARGMVCQERPMRLRVGEEEVAGIVTRITPRRG